MPGKGEARFVLEGIRIPAGRWTEFQFEIVPVAAGYYVKRPYYNRAAQIQTARGFMGGNDS